MNTGESSTYTDSCARKFDIGLTAGIGIQIPIAGHFAISFEEKDDLNWHTSLFDEKVYTINSTSLLAGFSYLIK